MIDCFKKGYYYRLKKHYIDPDIDNWKPDLLDFKWRKCTKTVMDTYATPIGHEWSNFFWKDGGGFEKQFDVYLHDMEELDPKEVLIDLMEGA